MEEKDRRPLWGGGLLFRLSEMKLCGSIPKFV